MDDIHFQQDDLDPEEYPISTQILLNDLRYNLAEEKFLERDTRRLLYKGAYYYAHALLDYERAGWLPEGTYAETIAATYPNTDRRSLEGEGGSDRRLGVAKSVPPKELPL